TGKRERFVEGATAFRNARDFAQRHRDRLIQAANARANARARQTDTEAPSEAEITVAVTEQYEELLTNLWTERKLLRRTTNFKVLSPPYRCEKIPKWPARLSGRLAYHTC
ncbi:hypothetical protein C8A03DRAFT_19941, partial [Achaetomium macrosporum]